MYEFEPLTSDDPPNSIHWMNMLTANPFQIDT